MINYVSKDNNFGSKAGVSPALKPGIKI